MTSPQLPRWQSPGIGGADSYGYLWWLGRLLIDGRSFEWVGGLGYGGQRLYVVPSEDLVVAVTAGVYWQSHTQGLTGTTALETAMRAALTH
jgi:CubicO group peptidase (beta-lactamase class C family)